MKLTLSHSAGSTIVIVAITTRVFWGLVIDSPELYNAAWLSGLLGGVLALPIIWCMQLIYRDTDENFLPANLQWSNVPKFLFYIVLILSLLNDGAIIIRGIANSAGHIAFEDIPMPVLQLPLYLLGFWCIYCNGSAVGAGARIWLKTLPLLMIIILILQFPYYHIHWLTPILGPGLRSIINGAIKAAGWITTMGGVLVIVPRASDQDIYRIKPFKILGIIITLAVFLTTLRLMMTPIQSSGRYFMRFFQLDALLTNGRTPFATQLPMITIWFISLINLMVYDCFVAAALLQRIFVKVDGRICGLIVLVCIAVLSFFNLPQHWIGGVFSKWQFVIIASAVALTMIVDLFSKGGKQSCASAK